MRVCVISPEIVGPHKNGGIGTHSYYLSVFLSRELGQEVTFVYTGEIENHDEAYWKKWFKSNAGIEFVWLAPTPIGDNLSPDPTSFVCTTGIVYEWLRERSFDVCYFQEMLGNGFRCFQAKRLGLAFQNTLLTCTVHSSWEWINQAMQNFPRFGRTELESKYMERYSIEHCDVLLSPSQYMLDWVAQNRIPVPAPQYVVPYLFNPEVHSVGYRPVNRHVVFFGRLEVRKGILIFLDALRKLAAEMPKSESPIRITFLGRSGHTPDGSGKNSVEKARADVAGVFELELLSDLGHHDAMEYLAKHNDALVVCPSLVDNSPYAIIECLELGLNIIAARCGGIPELFEGDDRLFSPTVDALAAKLREGLSNQLPPIRKRYGAASSRELWTKFCRQTLAELEPAAPARSSGTTEAVHVLVVGDGSKAAVAETFASLASQSAAPASVTVVRMRNGGGEIERAAGERGWKVVSLDAVPKYQPESVVLVLRIGACLEAGAIGLFQAAMQAAGVAALSCRGFVKEENASANGDVSKRAFEPLGACLEGGIFYNALGEGAIAVRASQLEPIAENVDILVQRNGMWRFLAALSAQGKTVEVLPEVLVSFDSECGALRWEELDYTAHSQLLDAAGHGLPEWVRHALVNATAAHRGVQIVSAQQNGPKPRRSIGYKIRREARRIFRQMGIVDANGKGSAAR